jgi:hypothetical protein
MCTAIELEPGAKYRVGMTIPQPSLRAKRSNPILLVMAGLVPAIHVLASQKKDVDARDKPGHDELEDRSTAR